MRSDDVSGNPSWFTGDDIAFLTEWRRATHRNPELSGEEAETAKRVVDALTRTGPDQILSQLGGHGVAAVYNGAEDGLSILLRCELDALPIHELGDASWRSLIPGKAHLCGHDGHMAVLLGVARWLGINRPVRGRAILLFQPAEEDGSGAAQVIADSRYAQIAPDFALALHNMPGLPLGVAALNKGPMACASRGMKIVLSGRTAHASLPETGLSPVSAISRLMAELPMLGKGGSPVDHDFTLVTLTHVRIGDPAFGVAPGHAEIWVTLRSQRDAGMDVLLSRTETIVKKVGREESLNYSISYHDVFRHCENDVDATVLLEKALKANNISILKGNLPMRASEDFGRFGDSAKAGMFLIGAGLDCPALHNPDYDFPDTLIETGACVFIECLRSHLY